MVGFALPQFGESAHAELARFASTAEQLGAESLWVGDRLLAAVQPSVGYAGGDSIPQNFRACLDPFTALTVAATVTTSARLGFSVLVAPWYPPVQLARQLTSIDVVSRGRLISGFGIGWSPEEYQAAGAPFRGRGAQLDECLDALEALWTTDPVEFRGDRHHIPPSWVSLKPVQQPRPPVYLGAWSAAGVRRIGRRADGWLAVVGVPGGVQIDALDAQRRAIGEAAQAAGRDPAGIRTHVRVNVKAGTPVEQVGDAVKLLQDNGYRDVFVDMLYAVTGTDAQLEWVERLLAVDA
ncbi:TIGR03619 family F420-dependent LLM class oxidoreductase [Mycolicibacterium sp. CH28]|uniref:TIGR03619 family F420-dependent LLM class oxidoreductase n=1 Tax=Mycolicibacterium sp. CH28 TaxID=2512237 RepID=UPI0010801EEB|nr:TIGR03619 family F420-dependent LLM class oxidoreductase [Mycolicibacterium sp. CH28]TGD88214.1 TIGR03619 family F420-dependent LLM class oxidoreductase [Mycolicibacterium sp. CH28]